MVENPGIAVGISTLSVIVPEEWKGRRKEGEVGGKGKDDSWYLGDRRPCEV